MSPFSASFIAVGAVVLGVMYFTLPLLLLGLRRKVRALDSARRLGDPNAAEELKQMTHNWMYAWFAVLSAGVVALGCMRTCDTIDHKDALNAERQTVEAKAEVERKMTEIKLASDRAKAAHELRLQYVRSCRVTPEQAEQLVVESGAP